MHQSQIQYCLISWCCRKVYDTKITKSLLTTKQFQLKSHYSDQSSTVSSQSGWLKMLITRGYLTNILQRMMMTQQFSGYVHICHIFLKKNEFLRAFSDHFPKFKESYSWVKFSALSYQAATLSLLIVESFLYILPNSCVSTILQNSGGNPPW